MKELFIESIKTLFFNVIGLALFFKSSFYICEHNDMPILYEAALGILICIAIYFIRVDFLKPTIEEISRCAIILFLYASNRKLNDIEKDDISEITLNNSKVGEVVKELLDDIEINESKEKE